MRRQKRDPIGLRPAAGGVDLVRARTRRRQRNPAMTQKDDNMLILWTPRPWKSAGTWFVYTTLPYGIVLTKDNIITDHACRKARCPAHSATKFCQALFHQKRKAHDARSFCIATRRCFCSICVRCGQGIQLSRRTSWALVHEKQRATFRCWVWKKEPGGIFYFAQRAMSWCWKKTSPHGFCAGFPDDTGLCWKMIIETSRPLRCQYLSGHFVRAPWMPFASVISTNLNIVMKMLASVTIIILTVPALCLRYGHQCPCAV